MIRQPVQFFSQARTLGHYHVGPDQKVAAAHDAPHHN
jgi:hypothetical protein